jgi:hypothetical protein
VSEAGQPVLRYNYQTIKPPEGFVEKVSTNARKYAVPRSNYIHPLYGPDGEVLTEDFSKDHPHHRGIYWAWPEVDFGKERGDLHALQHVFARPTGKIKLTNGDRFAQVEAENRWLWQDVTPIVRETVVIRAWRSGEHGRHIDLTFRFIAIEDNVTIARRGTKAYGGLNIRLSPVKGLKLIHHAGPPNVQPRRAWSDSIGIRHGGTKSVGMAVFESTTNPHYPGDYVQYPNLPWFQPTFPKTGVRYPLKKSEPLELRYRLWIRGGGQATEAVYEKHWRQYNELSDSPRKE